LGHIKRQIDAMKRDVLEKNKEDHDIFPFLPNMIRGLNVSGPDAAMVSDTAGEVEMVSKGVPRKSVYNAVIKFLEKDDSKKLKLAYEADWWRKEFHRPYLFHRIYMQAPSGLRQSLALGLKDHIYQLRSYWDLFEDPADRKINSKFDIGIYKDQRDNGEYYLVVVPSKSGAGPEADIQEFMRDVRVVKYREYDQDRVQISSIEYPDNDNETTAAWNKSNIASNIKKRFHGRVDLEAIFPSDSWAKPNFTAEELQDKIRQNIVSGLDSQKLNSVLDDLLQNHDGKITLPDGLCLAADWLLGGFYHYEETIDGEGYALPLHKQPGQFEFEFTTLENETSKIVISRENLIRMISDLWEKDRVLALFFVRQISGMNDTQKGEDALSRTGPELAVKIKRSANGPVDLQRDPGFMRILKIIMPWYYLYFEKNGKGTPPAQEEGSQGVLLTWIGDDGKKEWALITPGQWQALMADASDYDHQFIETFIQFVTNSFLKSQSNSKRKSSAMISPGQGTALARTPGGIDLNSAKMRMNVRKEGAGVQMRFDRAMIERIRHNGFDGVDFKVESIIPVANLPLLLGLRREEYGIS